MKKASRILLTVGGVIDLVAGITLFVSAFYIFIAAIVFFSTGGGVSLFFSYPQDADAAEGAVVAAMTICAIVYTCSALLCVGLGVLAVVASRKSFNARDNAKKGDYITVIVLNAICDCPPAIVGAIFGLITYNKENPENK